MDNKLEKILNDLKEYDKENNPKYLYNKNFVAGESQVLYSGPYWDETEIIEAVNTLVTGKWVVAGENVRKFERMFAKKFGAKYAQMVNSGSSANLVLIAGLKKYFGWEDGDEVIVSPVGFPTTISTVVQNGLKPVFVDIEFDTLNFDITKIENKITHRTKAIFVSPVLGNPPDMDYLTRLCNKYSLQLIGDSCDSIGSKWDGNDISDYYVAWSSSFYPAHHISTGEGGMVCTNIHQLSKLFTSFTWWGRDCHPAGTSIYTTNGVKNIENIVIGDKVYTHNGNYEKVYDLIKKNYNGNLFTIKSMRNEDIKVTENHPLYVMRGNKIEWTQPKDIIKGDFLVQKVPDNKATPKNLEYSYKTLLKTKNFKLNIEGDLFRLIGYWLAEGSLGKGNKGSNGKNKQNVKNKYLYYRVDFSFNVKEINYIDDVKYLMKKYFGVSMITRKPKGNGVSITFKTRKGYEFFNKTLKTSSYNKMLPYEFIHYDKNLLIELVKGYWRGDGSNDFQSVSLATTNINLANQFRLILSRFNISPNLLVRTPDKHTPSIVNGKLIEAKRDLYNLVSYGKNAEIFSDLINEGWSKKKNHYVSEYFTEDKKYAIHEITSIEVNDVKDLEVFNFEVEKDESYHANGIVSHNCYCVGSANLLPCGTCGNRFDQWLDSYDGIIDHKYVFANMGYNLKPMDLQGSIGLVQLRKFDEIDSNRKASKYNIENILLNYVEGLSGVKMLSKADACWFGTPFICETKTLKDKLVAFLEENKIQTRNYFAGNILMHDGYKHLGNLNSYPKANTVLDKVFFLGAAPHYTSEVFDYIDKIFKEKWVN